MKVRDSGPTPRVTFEREGTWLVVHGRGGRDVAWFLQLLRDAAATAQRERAEALLIDARDFSAPLTDLDRYDVGMVGASAGIAIPCAVVLSEATIDPRRLGETVARNRGVNARAFTSPDEARAWLALQTPPNG